MEKAPCGVAGIGRTRAERVEIRLELRQRRAHVRARLELGPAPVVDELEVRLDGVVDGLLLLQRLRKQLSGCSSALFIVSIAGTFYVFLWYPWSLSVEPRFVGRSRSTSHASSGDAGSVVLIPRVAKAAADSARTSIPGISS